MCIRDSPWAWPVEVFVVHDETDKLVTSNGKLDEAVRKAVETFNEQAEAPRNAGLDYDSGGSRSVSYTHLDVYKRQI